VKEKYEIKKVSYEETKPFILDIHYAKRMPPLQIAYGLYSDKDLLGICSYGIPPSHTLLKGVCGEHFKKDVIELNRLVLKNNNKNEASFLVGNSLKKLGNKIVVSYADSTQGHVGIVYQATNFLYTGITKPIKEIYLKSKPHLHHATYRGKTYKQMEEEYGDDVGYRLRSLKHRYVIFVGDKSFTKKAKANLNYPIMPYPKAKAT
jgi:hypothetical protein|tara:strand:+ start:11259 stop:11873 length:615 start_codon:yes stop_codon:yes gene_type:complete